MNTVTVGLVWAQSANGVIGREGALPWHLPEDLTHFRALTADTTVVMGRRTWESLPARFRPLPGRRNVVLTRDPNWSADGATVATAPAGALAAAEGDVWVIGGASVYDAALPYADRLVVTEIEEVFDGDVQAPELDPASWELTACDPRQGWHESTTGLRYRICRYTSRSTTTGA